MVAEVRFRCPGGILGSLANGATGSVLRRYWLGIFSAGFDLDRQDEDPDTEAKEESDKEVARYVHQHRVILYQDPDTEKEAGPARCTEQRP